MLCVVDVSLFIVYVDGFHVTTHISDGLARLLNPSSLTFTNEQNSKYADLFRPVLELLGPQQDSSLSSNTVNCEVI